MTLAQLDSELGPDELVYWEAYFERETFTRQERWLQSAMVRATLLHALSPEAPMPDLSALMPPDPWSGDGDS